MGWRALLEEDERVVAAVELPAAEAERAAALVNRGVFVESTVAALTTAEGHERVASESLELRLLRVNALYLLALWLHAAQTRPDLFIPLEPAPAPLQADTVYERAGFEAELSEMARSVASLYKAAHGRTSWGPNHESRTGADLSVGRDAQPFSGSSSPDAW